MNCSGSRPCSLFNDIVEDLEHILEKDKKTVIQAMQKTKLSFDTNSKSEYYRTLISNILEDIHDKNVLTQTHFNLSTLIQSLYTVPESNVRMCFTELIEKLSL